MSLPLPSCYWKIAPCRNGGKPFDAGPVCISHTLTHSYTENTFHPLYPKQPIALAGICDPNPYFNFPSLMQTNSILVAFPHKRSAMWEMSFFSCCIYKRPNQTHFWVGHCLYQLWLSRPAYRQILGSGENLICDTFTPQSNEADFLYFVFRVHWDNVRYI